MECMSRVSVGCKDVLDTSLTGAKRVLFKLCRLVKCLKQAVTRIAS